MTSEGSIRRIIKGPCSRHPFVVCECPGVGHTRLTHVLTYLAAMYKRSARLHEFTLAKDYRRAYDLVQPLQSASGSNPSPAKDRPEERQQKRRTR